MSARKHTRLVGATAALSLGMLGFAPGAAATGSNPAESVTTVTGAQFAQALVGEGVTVENVTYTGATAALGHFSFTDPAVDRLGFPGFRYDARADTRAWAMTFAMLNESLG